MIRKVTALLIAALTIVAGSVEAQTKDSPILLYKGDYPTSTRTKTVIPKYPSTSRSGSMVLELTIRPNGTVEAVKAIRPQPGATQAAVAAVKQWKFQPVIFRGKPAWAVLDILISRRSPGPPSSPATRRRLGMRTERPEWKSVSILVRAERPPESNR